MGYTDEMLATAKTMRFDPERLLACDGLGDQEETIRTSPTGSTPFAIFTSIPPAAAPASTT